LATAVGEIVQCADYVILSHEKVFRPFSLGVGCGAATPHRKLQLVTTRSQRLGINAPLGTWLWTFEFHKRRGISWLAEWV